VRAAARTRALVVDLSDIRARNWVMADRVHPTAFGQVAIAERALDVLARDGARPAVRPSTLIDYETTRWKRLRGDATYVYRSVKGGLRALAARL
jgi:phospholipase/lecithinase/hemolysin